LHRYLLDYPDCEIDHIDLNRFNNRRGNLRLCTHRQNQCNHGLQANNSSGAAGVRFYKPRNKYAARIKHYGQEIHLGYYSDKVQAMQARNVAMQFLFNEFARLNDVPEAPDTIKTFVLEKCKPFFHTHKDWLESGCLSLQHTITSNIPVTSTSCDFPRSER
jgi:hypothetical protein